jgi:AcrR family transcriptional regulator
MSAESIQMTPVLEQTEGDVRARVIVTAERLFREVGYQKTTVADIAKALGMSPANVYRFFDSKRTIREAVARHLMSGVEAAAEAIARKPLPAGRRLRELAATVHHMNAERYVGDSRLHEMVAIAMEEDWEVCKGHMLHITGVIGSIIADGVAAGEFRAANVELAAMCTSTAMARFFHPQLIAQCADKPGPTLDQMVDYLLTALSARPRH